MQKKLVIYLALPKDYCIFAIHHQDNGGIVYMNTQIFAR